MVGEYSSFTDVEWTVPLLCAPFLLELARFLVAAVTNTHRMVPASRGHRAALRGAVVTHALAAGAAVVDGEAGGELPLALAAAADVLVRHPVGWPGGVLHQAQRDVYGRDHGS